MLYVLAESSSRAGSPPYGFLVPGARHELVSCGGAFSRELIAGPWLRLLVGSLFLALAIAIVSARICQRSGHLRARPGFGVLAWFDPGSYNHFHVGLAL